MTQFSNLASVSDALSFGTALTSVGSAAYSVASSLIDNTPTGPHGVSYLNWLLRLSFSTALTAGSGAPTIVLYPLAALDGTNMPNPPGSVASAPLPNQRGLTAVLIASAAYSIIDFGDPTGGYPLGPFKYGFQLYNNSGVAWSGGGTITATLYRWDVQGA